MNTFQGRAFFRITPPTLRFRREYSQNLSGTSVFVGVRWQWEEITILRDSAFMLLNCVVTFMVLTSSVCSAVCAFGTCHTLQLQTDGVKRSWDWEWPLFWRFLLAGGPLTMMMTYIWLLPMIASMWDNVTMVSILNKEQCNNIIIVCRVS